jgi:hypothetical protein
MHEQLRQRMFHSLNREDRRVTKKLPAVANL